MTAPVKKDSKILASDIVSQFGANYKHVIIQYHSDEKFIKLYKEKIALLSALFQNLMSNRPVTHSPSRGSFMLSLETPEEKSQKGIREVAALLQNVKRQIASHPFLQPHQSEWKGFQEKQDDLSNQVFEFLKRDQDGGFAFYTKLVLTEGVQSFLKTSVMPYAFSTGAVFTPRGSISWGSLILEWGRFHKDHESLATNFMQQHPNYAMIDAYNRSFLPDPNIFPETGLKKSSSCEFRVYLIVRTIESLQQIVRYIFPSKIHEKLFQIFANSETARMDVSFEMGYYRRLLTSQCIHDDTNTKEILQFFRLLMNLLISHIPQDTPFNDPHVQQIILWAYASSGVRVGGIASHDYTYTLNELEKTRKGANQSFPEIKYSPQELVTAVRGLSLLYEHPKRKNGESFDKVALALIMTYISIRPTLGWKFVLDCFHDPLMIISTEQVIDFPTEQGHKNDLKEESAFFQAVAEKLPRDRLRPSRFYFSIFITRYDSSLDVRTKRVATFFELFKKQTPQPEESDAYFKALHRYLRGNQVCDVARLFAQVFRAIVPFQFLYDLEDVELPVIANIEDRAAEELLGFANKIQRSLTPVMKKYRIEKSFLFRVFYCCFAFFDQPEVLDSYVKMFQDFEAFLGHKLPRFVVFRILTAPISSTEAALFFTQMDTLTGILSAKRQQIITQESDHFAIDSGLLREVHEFLSQIVTVGKGHAQLDLPISYLKNLLQFAILGPEAGYHIRSFPVGIREGEQIRFSSGSYAGALFSLDDTFKTYRAAAGDWKVVGLGLVYHFQLVNTLTQETYSHEVMLRLSAALFQQEPELFIVLKKLCYFTCNDVLVDEGKRQSQGFQAFLALYPKARETWESYVPNSIEKYLLEKPILDFLSHLKLLSRQTLLAFSAKQEYAFPKTKSMQQVAAERHITAVQVKGHTTYSCLPENLCGSSTPQFSFYAAVEDLTALEAAIDKTPKTALTPYQQEAATGVIVPFEDQNSRPTYSCLCQPLEQRDPRFGFYVAVEDVNSIVRTLDNLKLQRTNFFQESLTTVKLQVSANEKDPLFIALELSFFFDPITEMRTLQLVGTNVPFPLSVRHSYAPQAESLEITLKLLLARLKGAFYKNLLRYQPLKKQPFIVSLDHKTPSSPAPLLYVSASPRKVCIVDPLSHHDHKHCLQVDCLELALSMYYHGKVTETALTFQLDELRAPFKRLDRLLYLLALHKGAFYKTHFGVSYNPPKVDLTDSQPSVSETQIIAEEFTLL